MKRVTTSFRALTVFSALLATPCVTNADDPADAPRSNLSLGAFDSGDLDSSSSRLRSWVERFETDLRSIERFQAIDISPRYRVRLSQLRKAWRDQLETIDFSTLERDEQIDWLLLRLHLNRGLRDIERSDEQYGEIAELLPFAEEIVGLHENRQRIEPVDARSAAEELHKLAKQVAQTQARIERRRGGPAAESDGGDEKDAPRAPVPTKPTVVNRAADAVGRVRGVLRGWYDFYNEYDPLFTWWVEQPFQELDQALEAYGRALRERVTGASGGDRRAQTGATAQPAGDARPSGGGGGRAGGFGGGGQAVFGGRGARAFGGEPPDNRGPIVGNPVGRDALLDALRFELIPYTPEELISIGEREMAWCEGEMKKAAAELGFGDDWKAALEHVKRQHLEPGKQPELVRTLAREAIDFLEQRDLVTIPPLAKETWRMSMMSPDAQLQNPFFLGGESIIVAFPTRSMSHEAKLMSMRGNNVHFARATVFHELIPGHNLQAFMNSRHHTYRRAFSTPFWTEGWALYWEIRFWELGFPRSPEDRIGMLFWRMHRGARILFSLRFHLEEMKPQECIDFLVDRVGHERANAEAEVRRSFQGGYEPLYQCAYLLGGLQFRSLHRELVESGKMTERAFHDAILKQSNMPVALVRASLTEEPLDRELVPRWKFDAAKD